MSDINYSLGSERIVREASKWQRVEYLSKLEDSDAHQWQWLADIALFTKRIDGEQHVRTLVPVTVSDNTRFRMVTKSVREVSPDDVILFRTRGEFTVYTSHTHVAIGHDRDVNVIGYSLVGVSGKVKDGKVTKFKYFWYEPSDTELRDENGKLVETWKRTSNPVVMDARCIRKFDGLMFHELLAKQVKEYWLDFVEFYGMDSTQDSYLHMSHAKRTEARIENAMVRLSDESNNTTDESKSQ